MVDDFEKYNNDRQDVIDINTDETVEDAETEPLADDCTSTWLHASRIYLLDRSLNLFLLMRGVDGVLQHRIEEISDWYLHRFRKAGLTICGA